MGIDMQNIVDKIKIFRVFVVVLSIQLFSCDKYRKIEVKGVPGVYYELSTSNDFFEKYETTYYRIIDSSGTVLVQKKWLLCNGYNEVDLDMYNAKSVDSIIYLEFNGYLDCAYDLTKKVEYKYGVDDSIMQFLTDKVNKK